MLLLEANGIEKTFSERLIFKMEQSLYIYSGDRIGIVGVNGAGKSTLLHILAGMEEPDSGDVKIYGTTAIFSQLGKEEKRPSEQLQSKWKVKDLRFSTMSGGEKTRLKLANVLANEPNLLFLDEPTSHLDLDGIDHLEEELKKHKGALVLISHDREFLDSLCTKIIEIESAKVIEYKGNYSAYRDQKEHNRQRHQAEYEAYVKEKTRLQQAAREKAQKVKSMKKKPRRMSYSDAKAAMGNAEVNKKQGSLSKSVKAIEKRIDQLEKKERPKEIEVVQFNLNYFSQIHNKTVVQAQEVTKSFDDRLLFNDLSFIVKPGMKVALIGENGAGKSTLLNMIYSRDPQFTLSNAVEIGYFHQDLSLLDVNKTILENVQQSSNYPESFIRTVLARLLFKQNDVYKVVDNLSGGERVKTALTKLFLGHYNMLLLDEPTNYLDIFSQEALEQVLIAYPGTIIFATHDRRLMKTLADHLLIIENKTVRSFSGNYDSYVKKKQEDDGRSSNIEEERLRLELELSDVIGRLSISRKEDNKEELERRYDQLIKEINRIKQKK